MDGVKFSFIMPTYNRSGYFIEAVNSIVNQSYDNWELIIVDDYSEYEELEKKYKYVELLNDERIKFISLNQNYGHCYARNYGIKNSTGDWIVYADDDNATNQKCCEYLLDSISDDVEVITAKYLVIKDSEEIEKGLDYAKVNIFERNQLDTCAFAHRRSCVEKYGGWDTSFLRMADDEIIFRYVSKCNGYKFCDKVVATFFERDNLKRVMNQIDSLPYMRKLYSEFPQLYKGRSIIVTNDDVSEDFFDISNFIDFDVSNSLNEPLELFKRFAYQYDYVLIINNHNDRIINDLFSGVIKNNYYEKNGNIAFKTNNSKALQEILRNR